VNIEKIPVRPFNLPEPGKSNKRFMTLDEMEKAGFVISGAPSSGIDPLTAWLNHPVEVQRLMDQKVLNGMLAGMEQKMAAMPDDELQRAAQRQHIDQHNATIEAAKAQKKQLRQIAKQARMSVEAVKRMVKTVRRA